MQQIKEYFDIAVAFFQEIFNTGKGDFYGSIMLIILSFILYWFIRKPFESLLKSFSLFRDRQFIIPKALRTYKECLDKETYKLSHSWKLERQTLKEIIVPVHIENVSERTSLVEYINLIFLNQNTKNQRFILLGEAGSGKSVAMGEIARKIWEVKRGTFLLPILLKFSEIKHIKNEAEFVDIIVKNLERNQFEGGKNTHKAEEYVKLHLYNGSILLLLDGFDELEKTTRFEIAQFLNHFLQTYQNIPFVISCRNSVWKQNPTAFQPLSFSTITMANFTPYDIRTFVSQWDFIDNKSSEQLADLINSKSYLKAIATNPLMLTIITFLYAQPKRILPDNRVKFYEECVDALLEKWDNAKSLDRANVFETIDKVSILSYLAYQHIVDNKTTDEEISKENILKGIEVVMRKLSRPVEKREKMLSELVENAELLIALPPDGYKFPHRTFMEYFAAKYFFENNKVDELLELYHYDAGKWEETLCLFSGLNTNSTIADKVLLTFINDFEANKMQAATNTIVFRLLVESARINPILANQILDLADSYLKTRINKEIVENLGFIAINPNWEHAKKAKSILLNQVGNSITNHDNFQTVIMALGSIKDADIQNIILRYADKIDLVTFLTKLGNDSEIYAQKLLDSLGIEKSIEVLEGLKNAGNLTFLMNLMVRSTNETLQQETALQLAAIPLSNFDNAPFEEVTPSLKREVENKYKDWGWKYTEPKTANGQKSAFLVSILISRLFAKDIKTQLPSMNKLVNFMTCAFLLESKCNFEKYKFFFPKLSDEIFDTNYKGLLSIWKKKKKRNLFDYLLSITAINVVILFICCIYQNKNILLLLVFWSVSSIIATFFIEKDKKRDLGRYSYTVFTIFIMSPNLLFTHIIDSGESFINLKRKREYLTLGQNLALGISYIVNLYLTYFAIGVPFLKYCIIIPNFIGLVFFLISPFVFPLIMTFFPNQSLVEYLSEKENGI